MEDSYRPYYKLNEYFSSSVGLWPYQTKIQQRVLTFIALLFILSLLLIESLGLRKHWGDLDTIINCLPQYLMTIASVIALFCGTTNIEKMERLFSTIEEDWSIWRSGREFEILCDYASQGRKYAATFGFIMYYLVFAFLAEPLASPLLDLIIPLNESRPRRTNFIGDYFVDEQKYYYWIALHACISCLVEMTILLSVDMVFMVVLYHACGELAILGFKLQNLVKMDDNKLIIDHVHIQKEIKFCAEKHESVMIFVKEMVDYFSIALFSSLGLHMIMISITGVQTVINLDDPRKAYTYALETVGQMSHIFCLSIPAQKLIDHSLQLSESIYYGYWYHMSPGSQKLLQIIMMRSAKPCSFTAGKLYVFSMENFLAIIRTSMSYFTVLSSVRE